MVILEIFLYNNYNCVANSYKEYTSVKSKKNQEKKLFFREDNYCYCITGDNLLLLFSKLRDFPYAVNKKAISAQLIHHGLLKLRGGEYSFPLNGSSSKTRYYHLYINQIIDLIKGFFSPEEIRNADFMSPLPELNSHINI